MYVIKKIHLVSFARFSGLMLAIISVIPWLIVAIVIGVLGLIFGEFSRGFRLDDIFFPGIIWLLAPAIAYLAGFFVGLLYAWIYNLLANRFGGIKLDIELGSSQTPPHQQIQQ